MKRRNFLTAVAASATASLAGCSAAQEGSYSADVTHEVEREDGETIVNCDGDVGLNCHAGYGGIVDLMVTVTASGTDSKSVKTYNQVVEVVVDNCGVNYEFGASFVLDGSPSSVSSTVEIVNVTPQK